MGNGWSVRVLVFRCNKMDRQRTIFFLIIGAALLLIVGGSLLGRWFGIRLGPPDLDATATVVALRSTQVAIQATETALRGGAPGQGAGQTWNGLEIQVLTVEQDGWPLVHAFNQFNDPPHEGRRMLLVTVEVRKAPGGDDQPVKVDAADFKVVGERKEVYTTYGDETYCGDVPDGLRGVVTAGQPLRGAICFQVPEDERGFVLVYEPYVGDTPAVYIPLPAGE